MQPSFHRRFANTERFRSLGDIEVLYVSQNEDFVVDVRQLGQCIGDCFAHFLLLNGITREFPPVGELLRVCR